MKKFIILLFAIISCTSICYASFHNEQQEQKHYIALPLPAGFIKLDTNKVLSNNHVKKFLQQDNGKIQVLELFSYACHACNAFEPALEKWLHNEINKNKKVVFRRMPMVFFDVWLPYAKIYFAAQYQNIAHQLTPLFFKEIFENKNYKLNKPEILRNFLVKINQNKNIGINIDVNKFMNTYMSLSINKDVNESMNIMQSMAITSTPTFIVNGQYKIMPSKNLSYKKMLQSTNELLKTISPLDIK